jgi:hypothetical protein
MKVGNLLFSAAQFGFAVLVMLTGVFFIGLGYASHLRVLIARFIVESSLPFSMVGFLILGSGILLMLGFYAMNRGVYFTVAMGKKGVLVDPTLVRGYLDVFWKEKFPGLDLGVDVSVSKEQKLEIFVEMPTFPKRDLEGFLVEVEGELSLLLRSKIGYKSPFQLSLLVK